MTEARTRKGLLDRLASGELTVFDRTWLLDGTPQGVLDAIASGELTVFAKMLYDLEHEPGPTMPKLAETLGTHLIGAEARYLEGDVPAALLHLWIVAKLWAKFSSAKARIDTSIEAPKIMREKRKTTPAGRKANAEAAWTRAFQAHKPFRRWEARDQAEYLAAKHGADVTGITPETLAKYVRAFRKKAQ